MTVAPPDDTPHDELPIDATTSGDPLGLDAGDEAGLHPVRLGPVRAGERFRRRRQRARAKRRRVYAVAGSVAILGAGVFGIASLGGGSEETPGDAAPVAPSGPAVPPVLFAQQDAAGIAVSLAILVPGPSGEGGSIVLVPPGTMTEVASIGLEPVGQALQLGGPGRLVATIENLLGAELAQVAVVDDTGLAALLAPAGNLTLDVPERVEQVDPAGRVTVEFEAGRTLVTPEEAGRLLALKGRTNDLARLARHHGFWQAWLAAIAANPAALPADDANGLRSALEALARGEVDIRVLPVEAVGTVPEAGELYKVRDDELERLVADVWALGTETTPERPRIQILNGTGEVELASRVADVLVPAGVEVKLTGNAATFDHLETQIVFYDKDEQSIAQRVRDALGVGKLVLSRRPLNVVDVTVIVGKDFRSQR